MFGSSYWNRWQTLGNIQYTPQIAPAVEVPIVEKKYVAPTGDFEVEYTYINGTTNKREWNKLELEGYLKNNDFCTVLKDATESMFKNHKEGKEFTIISITQK